MRHRVNNVRRNGTQSEEPRKIQQVPQNTDGVYAVRVLTCGMDLRNISAPHLQQEFRRCSELNCQWARNLEVHCDAVHQDMLKNGQAQR